MRKKLISMLPIRKCSAFIVDPLGKLKSASCCFRMNASSTKRLIGQNKDRHTKKASSSSCEEPGMINAASRRELAGVDHLDHAVDRFAIGLGDTGVAAPPV